MSVANRTLVEDPLVAGQAWLRPYGITAVARDAGIVEAIPDTISLDALRRNDPSYTNLLNFFVRFFPPSKPPAATGRRGHASASLAGWPLTFSGARRNFVESLAPYCVMSYLLQLKDRHNANLLLDAQGHLVHIDYGFVFESSPGRNMQWEQAPFKLTSEMVALICADDDGNESSSPERFTAFRGLCGRCFLALRRHSHQVSSLAMLMLQSNLFKWRAERSLFFIMLQLTILVDVMAAGHGDFTCWQGLPQEAAESFRDRFQLELSSNQVTAKGRRVSVRPPALAPTS